MPRFTPSALAEEATGSHARVTPITSMFLPPFVPARTYTSPEAEIAQILISPAAILEPEV